MPNEVKNLLLLPHFLLLLVDYKSYSTAALVHTTATTNCSNFNCKSRLFLSSSSIAAHGDGICRDSHEERNELLVKTFESFKLSDVYLMEANLQSNIRNWNKTKRVSMDPNTGSCLFSLDRRFLEYGGESESSDGNNNVPTLTPSIINRCDWVCDELAFGSDVCELLDEIESKQNFAADADSFSLDYISMGRKPPLQSSNDEHLCYTSKSLSFRVAQLLLPATAALNPKKAQLQLLLIDTPIGIFLGRKRKFTRDGDETKNIITKWSSRPFQYSSAVNPTIAVIAVDLIHDLVVQHKRISSTTRTTNSKVSMADVTCGSGTFLALALAHGMEVHGFDINEKCVTGTRKNLEFLFGQDMVNSRCNLKVEDSSSTTITVDVGNDGDTGNAPFDCVISNLPWGQNTMMSIEENKLILRQMTRRLKENAFCAFITKDEKLQSIMEEFGFCILDSAHVPQQNFVLPANKKGKKNKSSDRSISSNCIVTIAQYSKGKKKIKGDTFYK